MSKTTLPYALYFECPHCGRQVDVGGASEEVTRDQMRQLAKERTGGHLEEFCHMCQKRVIAPVAAIRSRVRN